MLTIHVLPRRLKEFLLTHPLYKSPHRLVCLPMWDLLRVICWLFSVALCWFAFQRAALFRATVLGTPLRFLTTC